MAKSRLLNSGELLAKYAPTFAEVEMVPSGAFGTRFNRNGFYLRPARAGTPIEFTKWISAEDEPVPWPYIDVVTAGIKSQFIYDGSTETRTPKEWLRNHFFAALKDQVLTDRTFKLRIPGSPSENRFRLSVIIEGPLVPGWHDGGEVWTNVTAFLPYHTPEYFAYAAALRYEYAQRQAKAVRGQPSPVDVVSAQLVAAREAQAALAPA